jgi:small GTP-binding protein
MPDLINFRVMLIGDSAVGKRQSSIGILMIASQGDLSIGVGFQSICERTSGQRTSIEIWDTAGQEQYHSLTPLYFRAAVGAIAVFDVSRHHSYNWRKQCISEFIAVAGDHAVIAIAANKRDLTESMEKVIADAQLLALESEYIFEETSARTNQGIQKLFQRFLTAVVTPVTTKDPPAAETLTDAEETVPMRVLNSEGILWRANPCPLDLL